MTNETSKLIKPKSIKSEYGIPTETSYNWGRPGAKNCPTPIRLPCGGLFFERSEVAAYIEKAKRRDR
jgi:predicted DNA-binding transcriptional regulator AlpA